MSLRMPVTLALVAVLTIGAALGIGTIFAPPPGTGTAIVMEDDPRHEEETLGDPATGALPAEPAQSDSIQAEAILPDTSQMPEPARQQAADTPLAEPAQPPIPQVAARPGRRNIAWNLAEVSYWATQQPFIDAMRTAQPWVGHLPGQWGGRDETELAAEGALDDDGWPVSVPNGLTHISTMVFDDMSPEMTSFAGEYRAQWDGDGNVTFRMAARNVRYGDNSAQFDFTPGDGPVTIELRGGDLRNLTIVHEDLIAAHDDGRMFHPGFLARIGDAELLRFLNWMHTNGSTLSRWEDRPLPSDYSFGRHGVPLEVMIRLANETGAEPWFTLPHMADDDFIRRFAAMVHAGLDPELRAWVEYSNEVWNFTFQQSHWAEEQARARWGQEWVWTQFYALRATEVVRIWNAVFADAPERLVRVISVFTAWQGLEQDMLTAPLWREEDAGIDPPYRHFDAYAVAAYFNPELHHPDRRAMIGEWLAQSRAAAEDLAAERNLSGDARDAFIAAHRFDLALSRAGQELLDGGVSGQSEGSVQFLAEQVLPYHRDVAAELNMALVMYEGGTHVVAAPSQHDDTELLAFFEALNHSAEMGEAYRRMMAAWAALTPAPFNGYVAIGSPMIWGSWGALRHQDDDNPRWQAIMEMSGR